MNHNSRTHLFCRHLGHVASIVAVVTALAALAWASNEPWKTKPYQQWTDKDITRILTDSPWARPVAVEATWKPMQAEEPEAPGVPGNPSMGNGNPSMGNNGSNGNMPPTQQQAPTPDAAEDAGAARPEARFIVFWMSSKTMREAVARQAVLHSGKTEAAAEQYVNAPQDEYQVLIEGRDMTPFRQNELKYFQSHAFLQLKKPDQKVAPSHVTMERGKDGKSVTDAIFFFPKKNSSGQPLIGPNQKSVEFSCKLGSSTLKTSFNPRKMTNQTGEDL